jgi:hypothetical protein
MRSRAVYFVTRAILRAILAKIEESVLSTRVDRHRR